MEHIIDCKGLKCPQPVINTKKYFDSIKEGTAVIVVDNEVAKNNLCKLSDSNNFTHEVESIDGLFKVQITKTIACSTCEDINFENKKFTIVVSTDKLGNGDDKLGTILMKSYLYALSESDKIPTDLLFLNSGVKLTTEGSECIDSLNKLLERGTSLINCGTCLDFYGLKEKLLVGEISNMYTIIEKMNNADMTINL